MMSNKILSVFVDESGILSEQDCSSRFYILTLVLHDQSFGIEHQVESLNRDLDSVGIANLCFHAAPIIRANGSFEFMNWDLRRKIFSRMMGFVRNVDFKYHSLVVDKKFINTSDQIISKLENQLDDWIGESSLRIEDFQAIKVYYDCGQKRITNLLHSFFNKRKSLTVDFAQAVEPRKYKLFQVADLVCTLKLLEIKLQYGIGLAPCENRFFGGPKAFKHNILRRIKRKEV
jgi:hypothetical protein